MRLLYLIPFLALTLRPAQAQENAAVAGMPQLQQLLVGELTDTSAVVTALFDHALPAGTKAHFSIVAGKTYSRASRAKAAPHLQVETDGSREGGVAKVRIYYLQPHTDYEVTVKLDQKGQRMLPEGEVAPSRVFRTLASEEGTIKLAFGLWPQQGSADSPLLKRLARSQPDLLVHNTQGMPEASPEHRRQWMSLLNSSSMNQTLQNIPSWWLSESASSFGEGETALNRSRQYYLPIQHNRPLYRHLQPAKDLEVWLLDARVYTQSQPACLTWLSKGLTDSKAAYKVVVLPPAPADSASADWLQLYDWLTASGQDVVLLKGSEAGFYHMKRKANVEEFGFSYLLPPASARGQLPADKEALKLLHAAEGPSLVLLEYEGGKKPSLKMKYYDQNDRQRYNYSFAKAKK